MPLAGSITRDSWQTPSRFFQLTIFNKAENGISNWSKCHTYVQCQTLIEFKEIFKHLTQHGSTPSLLWHTTSYIENRQKLERESRTRFSSCVRFQVNATNKYFVSSKIHHSFSLLFPRYHRTHTSMSNWSCCSLLENQSYNYKYGMEYLN